MTVVEGFSIFGSLASAGAIGVAIAIYFFQNEAEKNNKREARKLKVDAMNRLLAHRAIPMCHRADFLTQCCLILLTYDVKQVSYNDNHKKILFIIDDENTDSNEDTIFQLNVPTGYLNLNESTLLVCAELSDRQNELMQIAIKINVGGDSFKEFIDMTIRHAKAKNLDGVKVIFTKNNRGEYFMVDHLYEVISYLSKLEPEIEHYSMYTKIKNTIYELKKRFISDKV